MFQSEYDLDNLGFELNELNKLLDENFSTFSEIKEQEYNEVFNIIIQCEDELEQESHFETLSKQGYKCQVQSL